MNRVVLLSLFTIGVMLFVFLMFAFVQWQFDPGYWTFEIRAICGIGMSLIAAIGAALIADEL